ncbi:hypothetical protein GCM10010517_03540 [Streptosporangium fragile]|uniref:Biotin carboxyl carrier protein of acetyl-CoA carboxylase n=1 Tax=Streptosporangium fragile TaxID=46186 RepID=A0ABN3VPE9_9ACTN
MSERITERQSPAEDAHATIRLLREEAGNLVKTIPGPVAGISLRLGECSLEVTWAPPQPSVPVPRPPAEAQAGRAVPPDPGPAEPGPSAAAWEHPASYAVTAPLVGTFYVAPEPGAPPFVQPGDRVDAGQTIGIVEAMKLMNPVTAERAGEVVEVIAGNGEPVEYGQVLVRIRTDAA